MITIPDFFIIDSKMPILVRKERDAYITFDPINLEYYKLNTTSTQILYFISINKSIDEIARILSREYMIEQKIILSDIREFLENFECKSLLIEYMNKKI